MNTTRKALMKKFAVVVVLLTMLVGCAGMSSTQQRTLSGGAIGAGTGAAIGAISGGSPMTGAVIGGAAGAAGGYLYDKSKK
ncbi:YMGG-like glycine zipper-containing protein [Desulfoferrobacter suflitae]|uniref:YMGG-like glycine zipper-containing protein n=1 Tax=Desulfoferrobacter suflitae TaxID=2865782 RepID=UPI002164A166|nr:YMGG-like glycine zipper-containing protein [Desulfoferrobacter suflitae]MCK8602758.1 YMGG-like glycine zipper-containing protein [Desulfoferrobacter suflitae]